TRRRGWLTSTFSRLANHSRSWDSRDNRCLLRRSRYKHVWLSRRGNLQHGVLADVNQINFAGTEQRIYCIASFRARNKEREEFFDLCLLCRYYGLQVLRNQRGKRRRQRKLHAFGDGLRRPLRERIPDCAFA